MATMQERRALLAHPCPWCGAGPRQECGTVLRNGVRRPITTLDGNAHDARWRAALGRTARVIMGRPDEDVRGSEQPVPAGRPW